MVELLSELLKERNEDASIDQIMSFAEDIMWHLEYEDNEDECETNQRMIGMIELFRGHVVKAWFDANMSSDVHRTLNKIIVCKCVEFYAKC